MLINNRSIIAVAIAGSMMFCAADLSSAYAQADSASQSKEEKANPANEKASPEAAKEKAAADDASTQKLALEEQRIADKYKHLEEIMLQMAELSAQTDPRAPRY